MYSKVRVVTFGVQFIFVVPCIRWGRCLSNESKVQHRAAETLNDDICRSQVVSPVNGLVNGGNADPEAVSEADSLAGLIGVRGVASPVCNLSTSAQGKRFIHKYPRRNNSMSCQARLPELILSERILLAIGALAFQIVEDNFAQADMVGGDFYIFVALDIFQSLFE